MGRGSMLLYGKNSVLERLRANPRSIHKVLLQEHFHEPHIEHKIRAKQVLVERVSARALMKMKRSDNTQGIIACVDLFDYTPLEALFPASQRKQRTLLFLDRISDPHNVGGIIRSAACFGGFAVVMHRARACEVNDTVLHVASGGENYVPIAMVSNLSNAIRIAKEHGVSMMGAVVSEDARDLRDVTLPFPLGIVLGSEGEGIRHGIQKHLDLKVRIPMDTTQLSFNVTVACGILCYEVTRLKRDVR